MGNITAEKDYCGIEGLCVISPELRTDERGWFQETYNRKELLERAGIADSFVQDNQSMSVKGVLRGLHFQIRHKQAKLIRTVKGCIYDVAVDRREGSPTFNRWAGVVLSEENKKQLYVPGGFAHGFVVLSDEAEICYKVTDFYHPDDEGGIRFDDPKIGVVWQLPEGFTKEDLILSEKDRNRELL